MLWQAIDTVIKGLATDKGLFGDQGNRKQFLVLKKLAAKLMAKLKYKAVGGYMFLDDREKPNNTK